MPYLRICNNNLHDAWNNDIGTKLHLKYVAKLNPVETNELLYAGTNIKHLLTVVEDVKDGKRAGRKGPSVCNLCRKKAKHICNKQSTIADHSYGSQYGSSSDDENSTDTEATSTDSVDTDEEVSESTNTNSLARDDVDEEKVEYVDKCTQTEAPDTLTSACTQTAEVTNEDPPTLVSVESVIKALDNFNVSDLRAVGEALSSLAVPHIQRDSQTISKGTNLRALLANDPESWYSERNPVLIGLIDGLQMPYRPKVTVTDSEKEKQQQQRLYSKTKAMESLYNIATVNMVSPFAFAESLVTYSVTNSKLAVNIRASSSPSGSYDTMRTVIKADATEKLPPPRGDIMVAFDNDQVIGRSYHVRVNNKPRTSVITSICVAEIQTSAVQEKEVLKPGNWAFHKNFDHMQQASHVKSDELHKDTVLINIAERLKIVKQQQMISAQNEISDAIDVKVHELQQTAILKVCVNCDHANNPRWLKCRRCKEDLPTFRIDEPEPAPRHTSRVPKVKRISMDGASKVVVTETAVHQKRDNLYNHISSGHPEIPPELHVRDPVFVNPNSYVSVTQVLRDIGKDVDICRYSEDGTSRRQWCVVVCDGLPYTIALKVITHTYWCQICRCGLYGIELIQKHNIEQHNLQEDQQDQREFDWVLLRIGLGHYEMNMARSLLDLNWEVFMKDVAKTMGFRSENAQKYAHKGGDHHKTWELLRITYLGSLDELLVPYVRQCIANDKEPSAEDYLFRWSDEVNNPNYQYLQEQVLTYIHSLMNFRAGVRRNNAMLVQSAMMKHAPVFHGRNHPRYQIIHMTEFANSIIMPDEVVEFVEGHYSISTSGNPSRGEDMDFQLEKFNKSSKTWTPKGTPTEEEWLCVFRNLDKLDGVRNVTLQLMGCHDPKNDIHHGTTHEPRDADIFAWRVALRDADYLSNVAEAGGIHTNLSGEELDPSLINMTLQGNDRQYHNMQVSFPDPSTDVEALRKNTPHPIFVLRKERDDYYAITNMTIAKIQEKIECLIEELDDMDIRSHFESRWRTTRNKKKEILINFFEELKEEVEDQVSLAVLLQNAREHDEDN